MTDPKIAFNTAVLQAYDAPYAPHLREAFLQAFLAYVETWLGDVAGLLDGTPPPLGIYVHADARWVYAVARDTTGFLRYRAGKDGKPLPFDLNRERTPQAFAQLEAHEVAGAVEAGSVPLMLETTAAAIAEKLPKVAETLRTGAKTLRAKQPLL